MGHIIQLGGHCRPSLLTRRLTAHSGDVSEGAARQPVAVRNICGRRVTFYRNGERRIDGVTLTDQELHDSELLRFAHASVLIGQPVGDRRKLWVDASQPQCEVWVAGVRVEELIARAKTAANLGVVPAGLVLDASTKDVITQGILAHV